MTDLQRRVLVAWTVVCAGGSVVVHLLVTVSIAGVNDSAVARLYRELSSSLPLWILAALVLIAAGLLAAAALRTLVLRIVGGDPFWVTATAVPLGLVGVLVLPTALAGG